jgi:hypothetical protein
MAYVAMDSVANAVVALMHMHLAAFAGRQLRVSFTTNSSAGPQVHVGHDDARGSLPSQAAAVAGSDEHGAAEGSAHASAVQTPS